MQEIEAVYQTTVRPTVLWLCKLLALLALGELYTNRRKLNDAQIIPGTNYYLQALHMLHDTYEEATLLHVEVLILIVSASQSLNQRHIINDRHGTQTAWDASDPHIPIVALS